MLKSAALSGLAGFCLLLAGCGDKSASTAPDIDAQLSVLVATNGMNADPSHGLSPISPDHSPFLKLGQLLFFSKTLGGSFDSACASCHHPDFAGTDALSLPVGVAAVNPDYLGPGRLIDAVADYDPLHDGGPNVPRNSQTIINAALYENAVFFDGRVQVIDPALTNGMFAIRTPDSANLGPDPNAGNSLLEAQSRFPVTAPDEMRNFFHPELAESEQFRSLLVSRLKGLADTSSLTYDGPANWLQRFRAAYGQPAATADQLITFQNIQSAIAAYERSLVFVDTPWRHYVSGDKSAISDSAKRGALLFLTSKADGGLGCVSCHSGAFFSNEKFSNVGFPQIGRGKRPDGRDFGRWQVTKQDADKFAFRVPSLVNVALTPPYGHAGTFQTLRELLQYHANPVKQVDSYDFSLQSLAQFKGMNTPYANAKRYTEEALASPTLSNLLPGRDLSSGEISDLSDFLDTLTDRCLAVSVHDCLAPWVPAKSDDPDGNLLVRSLDPSAQPGSGSSAPPPTYSSSIPLSQLSVSSRTTFPSTQGCNTSPVFKKDNDLLYNGGNYFTEIGGAIGLTLAHGFNFNTWFWNNSVLEFESTMEAGGVSVDYVDDDCWPDIIYAGGDVSGVVVYKNNSGGNFSLLDVMPATSEIGTLFTGVGFSDLQGDYRHELVLGNLIAGDVVVLKPDDTGAFKVIGRLPMGRNTFGISFGDYTGDGFPDIYSGIGISAVCLELPRLSGAITVEFPCYHPTARLGSGRHRDSIRHGSLPLPSMMLILMGFRISWWHLISGRRLWRGMTGRDVSWMLRTNPS